MSAGRIYTVGHSNRALRALVDVLAAARIRSVIDVRAYPKSPRHPYFSRGRLEVGLLIAEIAYEWVGDRLGGKHPSRADSPHLALAPSVRGFADYMQTSAFRTAIEDLIAWASKQPTAIMCAEKQPEQCHRSLIADYLMCRHVEVVHLIDGGERHEHQLAPTVRKTAHGLIYDRYETGTLDLQ